MISQWQQWQICTMLQIKGCSWCLLNDTPIHIRIHTHTMKQMQFIPLTLTWSEVLWIPPLTTHPRGHQLFWIFRVSPVSPPFSLQTNMFASASEGEVNGKIEDSFALIRITFSFCHEWRWPQSLWLFSLLHVCLPALLSSFFFLLFFSIPCFRDYCHSHILLKIQSFWFPPGLGCMQSCLKGLHRWGYWYQIYIYYSSWVC